MSKAFKSVFTSARGSGQKLSVGMTRDGYLNLTVRDSNGQPMGGVALALQDAPAVMLAVAQSSGITPAHKDEWAVGEPANLARIAADLQHHIEARDKAAKLDAQHAELARRRDDLASAFADCALDFNDVHVTVQRAIDYIIELEDRATK